MFVVEHQAGEPGGGLRLACLHQRVPADEFTLVQLHSESQAGLIGIHLGPDVGAPDSIPLFEPERIHGLVAAGAEPMIATRFPDRVPQPEPELGRAVQLPAELAYVRDAQRQARHGTDRQLSCGHVRERLVRDVGRGEWLQDLARRRSPQTDARQ